MYSRIILKDDGSPSPEDCLEFRLTYQGLLLAENNRGGVLGARAEHKQTVRKALHKQLKRLWDITPVLRNSKSMTDEADEFDLLRLGNPNTVEGLANRFRLNDYNFVPLINRTLGVTCEIDVLFLRNDPPGSIIKSGDIDNWLKTLFDALTMPHDAMQLGSFDKPDEGEKPFFVLLEDDSLITKASVETDTLLAPIGDEINVNDARVIIKVKTKLQELTRDSFGFL